jgi:amino-acid N-acetyltransferase
MVYRDDYRQIRKAVPADVPEIVSMIRDAVRDDELLPRSRADVLRLIDDYFVIELDSNVVGSVALHDLGEDAEIACLFIKRNHENSGHGRQLVSYAEKVARETGAGRVFAVSTQASGFFSRLGYQQVEGGALPPGRAEILAESGRNSKVFAKQLG